MSSLKPPSHRLHRLIANGMDWKRGQEGRPSGDVETYFEARRLGRQGLGRLVPDLYRRRKAEKQEP
jgi:hypothetical protein